MFVELYLVICISLLIMLGYLGIVLLLLGSRDVEVVVVRKRMVSEVEC